MEQLGFLLKTLIKILIGEITTRVGIPNTVSILVMMWLYVTRRDQAIHEVEKLKLMNITLGQDYIQKLLEREWYINSLMVVVILFWCAGSVFLVYRYLQEHEESTTELPSS